MERSIDAPRVLFVGRGYAGHRTRFANLEAHTRDDPRMRPTYACVTGWTEGGVLERLPLLPGGLKGRLRATLQAAPLATLPRPDVIWTGAAEVSVPYLWAQTGGLRRPLVLDLDWTIEQQEELAPLYFGRAPKRGLRLRLARLNERAVWSRVSLFTPWSNWTAASLRRQGVSEARIRVLPPGVDLDRWRPREGAAGRADGPLRLLFVGGDFLRKGGDVLLDVFRERLTGRCALDIVTRDALPPGAEAIPGVRLHRAEANTPQLMALYAGADLFVLPSRAECFGIATIEAMASGLPVVVGDVGGARDIVDDGETGWLIEAGAAPLAAAVERALAGRAALPAMGRRGRHVAEERFDGRRNDAVLVEWLLELARGRAAGRAGAPGGPGGPRTVGERRPAEPMAMVDRRSTASSGTPQMDEGIRAQGGTDGARREHTPATPSVSIVIAAYNARPYLRETLDSVLAQTYPDWELVIVDDGSRDDTLAVAREYAGRDRRIRVLHQENAGGAAARNRGYAETDGDAPYVAFLDADDVYEPDALRTLLRALEATPEAVAAHGLARFIDGESRPIREGESEAWGRNRLSVVGRRFVTAPLEAPTTLAMLALANRIATPGQGLIRRAALARTGPEPSDASTTVADWDMWLRLAVQGDIAFVDEVVLRYRQHGASMSSNHRQVVAGTKYVRRKLLASPDLSPAQRREVRRASVHAHRYGAGFAFAWARTHIRQGHLKDAAVHFLLGLRGYARYLRGDLG
jgi:glycosyltransferase involved in cell wall biosynthesis/GT2 family glycosyltransferase